MAAIASWIRCSLSIFSTLERAFLLGLLAIAFAVARATENSRNKGKLTTLAIAVLKVVRSKLVAYIVEISGDWRIPNVEK
jgi:hypothetical protein